MTLKSSISRNRLGRREGTLTLADFIDDFAVQSQLTLLAKSSIVAQPIHLILSVGTRIVTRNVVNVIGGARSVSAGGVGTILCAPADATHAYKVRFNDGAEAMVRR